MTSGQPFGRDVWDPAGRFAQFYPAKWARAFSHGPGTEEAFKIVSDYLARLNDLTGNIGGGGTTLTGPEFGAVRSSIGSLVPDWAARGLSGGSPDFLTNMVQENVGGAGVGRQFQPNILELVKRYLSQGSQGWPTL
jgi:hypothetical protein